MLSSKFSASTETDPIFALLHSKKKEIQEIFDLTIANPTKLGFDYSAFAQENSIWKFFDYSPNPQGLQETREAISEYYANKNRIVHPEHIFLTTGTSEAISYLFKLLCNPGDTILAPSPGYPLFDFIAELESLKIEKYKFKEVKADKEIFWKLDRIYLKNLLKQKPKVLILVEPNNPTGSILDEEDRNYLYNILQENKIVLVVDEVFSDYIDSSKSSIHEWKDTPCFYLNGISKMLGLPQMKLSWFYTKGLGKWENDVHSKLEIIADTFLSVNTPIQKIAPNFIINRNSFQKQILERIERNILFIEKNPLLSLTFHKPVGGWYGILEIQNSIPDEKYCLRILEKQNVHLHPGYLFEFENSNFLVFSLITKEENLQMAWQKIAEFENSLWGL